MISKNNKFYIFLTLILILIFAVSFRQEIFTLFRSVERRFFSKTVNDRIEQYSQIVKSRLLELFKNKNIPYPPNKLIFVAIKSKKKLEIWASGADGSYKFICEYPILAASGKLGPKLHEGDMQVPEGIYRIAYLNPNSKFHLSLKINYPNDYDKRIAEQEGRIDLGGDIMIHGSDVSIGCLAIGNQAVEDVFIIAALSGIKNVKVIISPIDFRTQKAEKLTKVSKEWIRKKYLQIQRELVMLKKEYL